MVTKEVVKRDLDILVRVVATTAAVAMRPEKAAGIWLEKMYKEGSENSIRKRIEKEFVGKHVFMTLLSNPTQVVWGYVERILWLEHLDGHYIVKHPVHGYKTPVSRDNVGLSHYFDKAEELDWYVQEEFRQGNIREGSFKMTRQGAIEVGNLALESILEFSSDGQNHSIEIPQDFANVLRATSEDFRRGPNRTAGYLGLFPRILEEHGALAERYPFEYIVVHTVVSYFFSMARNAALSEVVR